MVEDLEEGGSKDETRRLRFILDTIGKKTWPGGRVPEEWSELVRKHNEKAKAAERWVDAVNEERNWGLWRYLVVEDPAALPEVLNEYGLAKWDRESLEIRA